MNCDMTGNCSGVRGREGAVIEEEEQQEAKSR